MNQTKQKIKILHIISGLGTGGAETMLYKLIVFSQNVEHRVLSLSGGGPLYKKISALGVQVTRVNLKKLICIGTSIIEIRRLIAQFDPDLIQGWMYHGNIVASLCKRRSGQLIYWNIRHSIDHLEMESVSTRIALCLGRFFSRSTDLIIYNSHFSQITHQKYGYRTVRAQVIPNGFDLATYSVNPILRAETRQKLSITPESIVFGVIGRFHPHKDHANFIKAAGILCKKLPIIAPVFLMVGRGMNQSNQELMRQILEAHIMEKVILIEETDCIPALLNALDFLCLPSASEAFPNVVGEAMATGIPCIVTDVGDAKRIVQDSGFVVPPRNPQALAEQMEYGLGLSQDKKFLLGIKARTIIEKFYSIKHIIGQYESLYESR